MDAQTLKQKLLNQLPGVLSHLLPNGKEIHNRFHVGNIEGDEGKSLHVELSGDKAGLWTDRSIQGSGGDIFDLWMKVKGLTFVHALDDIRKYLGITEVQRIRKEKPQGFGQNPIGRILGSSVHSYLNNRGLNDDTLKRYRIRRHPDENQDAIAFRYWTSENVEGWVKYCSIHRDEKGKKKIWSTKPYPTLWGWWMVTPHDRSIIITEGEIDAMTVYQMEPGIPVLSMHSGASNLNWIDNDYDRLQQFETIYILTDRDEAGNASAEEVSKRLGMTRVARVPVPSPYNDPNEAWNSGDETLLDWNNWSKNATYFTPPSLRTPKAYLKDAHSILDKTKKEKDENDFVFEDMPIRYRDGETTIITGEPGHGKSDFLYQSHLHEMKIGKRVMICSLEIPPAKMLTILCQQLQGKVPGHEELDMQVDWLNDRMVYHSGVSPRGPHYPLSTKELLDDMEYAYRRFGVTRFIIDSLHFLVGKEDYEAQDTFTRELQQFDLAHDTHTALVAHANLKGRKDGSIPGRHDVEGSGGMIKPIDNGITIWRHEKKQDKIEDPDKYEITPEQAMDLHDGIIKVWKQRESGDHFQRKIWFDRESRTFRTRLNGQKHFFGEDEEQNEPTGKDF